VSYGKLPGFVAEHEAFGETTVTVEAASMRDACEYARDLLWTAAAHRSSSGRSSLGSSSESTRLAAAMKRERSCLVNAWSAKTLRCF